MVAEKGSKEETKHSSTEAETPHGSGGAGAAQIVSKTDQILTNLDLVKWRLPCII